VEVGETLGEAVRRETLKKVGFSSKTFNIGHFPSNLIRAFKAEYHAGDIHIQENELSDAQ